jgi:transcriptional/translational regulatory protein YebC/TACO1
VAEVRHAFTKSGGNLGTNGSVSYLFEKKGIITVSSEQDAEQIMEVSIEAGAEDIEINEDLTTTVSSSPEDFHNIKNALINQDFNIDDSEISLVPETTVQVDMDTSLKVFKLLEMLEDLDDTQNVTSNIEFADGMLEELD